MKRKRFIFLDDQSKGAICIITKRKPSINTIPARGTWVVYEWNAGKWEMPCFPEITWGRLRKLIYVGKIYINLDHIVDTNKMVGQGLEGEG